MSKKVNKSKIFTLHLTGIAFIYINKKINKNKNSHGKVLISIQELPVFKSKFQS